ncbi:MAG: hypothetical protein M5U34_48330 [Chloroflexi bacterium]|nr:hypothetical protein [Chloroflexota bacterium]
MYEQFGRSAPFIAGAALLAVASLVVVWRVREPRTIDATEEDKGAHVWGNLKRMASARG